MGMETSFKKTLPAGWRPGQFTFQFLHWLAENKHYTPDPYNRMADPFGIDVDEWNKLVDEYLEHVEA